MNMKYSSKRRCCNKLWPAVAFACVAAGPPASAQTTDNEDLAKKLANPVASLISVPFQFNWDDNIGANRDGRKFYLNLQPVIPAKIDPDWTLISRVILPIVSQRIPGIGDGSQSGVGDITGEFFLSPTSPGANGVIWGVGPAVLAPSNTDFISARKWALGPTAVVLKQDSGWTYGMLANHLWSVGGGGTQDISSTFLQPFLNYTTKDAWTFGLDAESTYDWENKQWSVPFNLTVSKLTRVGKLPVSIGGGARYWADSPVSGPHGWGARLIVTFLFPQ
jgi:hypothetical protein